MTTPAAPSWAGPVIDMTELPPADQVTFVTGQASNKILSLACLVLGWSALETSGTAATSGYLIDGGDDNGQRLGAWGAASGAAAAVPVPPPGLMCKDGLWVKVNTGAVSLTVWYIPLANGA